MVSDNISGGLVMEHPLLKFDETLLGWSIFNEGLYKENGLSY